jgi:hypothetical protein
MNTNVSLTQAETFAALEAIEAAYASAVSALNDVTSQDAWDITFARAVALRGAADRLRTAARN